MKQLIIAFSLLFSTLGLASSSMTKTKEMKKSGMEVDLKKSVINWKGTKVTGEHVGTLKLKSATLKGKDGKLASGTVVVDIDSINVTDLSGDWKKKLEGHLKNEDFFEISKWPTAKLEIEKVKDGKLHGSLTIKDKTNKVQIPFKKSGNTYTGKLKFDRTKFGMVYGSGDFFKNLGDKMIHNDVTFDFKVVLK